jgi:pimeloyl-ACP methyl ester carboxylesterase
MTRTVPLFLAVAVTLPLTLVAQEGTLRVDGDVELTYELSGNGPPLVLIHGWTHDMRSWELQTPTLQRHFTVLRYDRRGWGGSGGHPDVTMDPVDLDRILEALDMDSAFVVGHSQGADVALRFALAHPERVAALGLYGSPPPAGFGVPWTGPDAPPSPSDMASIVREGGVDSLGAVLFSGPLARGFDESEPGLELATAMWADNGGRDLEDPREPSNATPPPAFDRVSEIEVPTLVITGDLEMPYFQVVADALAYAIPDAERVTVSGGGHAVHMQEPERFTAELVRFFESP